MKKLVIVSLVLLIAMGLAFAGSDGKKQSEQQAQIVADPLVSNISQPAEKKNNSNETIIEQVSATQRVIMGTCDYDYGWNSGYSKYLVVHEGKVHFTFMDRNLGLVAPENRRAQAYVYYDGTNKKTGYPVAKATAASGFGSLDVFKGGVANGFAVMTAHTPIWVAVDAGPGEANFTKVDVPNAPDLDPEVTVDNARQILWLINTGASRGRYVVDKSEDYGGTWTRVDTNLMRHIVPANVHVVGALDAPILVAPNGNLAVVTTIRRSGATLTPGHMKPIGTCTSLDSTHQIGYFLSTNAGTSWNWNPIGFSAQRMIVGQDSLYPLFTNFGQFSAVYDKDSKLHVVANGYSLKAMLDADTVYASSTYFCTLYWKEGVSGWKMISNVADHSLPVWNTYKRSGNGLGFCYPSIAIDPEGNTVFSVWSQPRLLSDGSVDTTYNGPAKYDAWYTYSLDNGANWLPAVKLPNSDMAIFTSAASSLTKSTTGGSSTFTAHISYLADTSGGCSIQSGVTGGPTRFVDWYYHSIDFVTTSVNEQNNIPSAFSLDQNYPNPFNPSTSIKFTLSRTMDAKMTVVNLLGQEVGVILNERLSAGEHSIKFNASHLPSGVYFYRLAGDGMVTTKKMVLMK